MWRTNGSQRSGAGNALATEPVLGVPEVQPALLDNVSVAAWCRAGHSSARRRRGGSRCASPGARCARRAPRRQTGLTGSMDFLLDDEEDEEVFDDEDFDQDKDSEDADEDSEEDDEEDDEEEEEGWQVSSFLTS